MLPVLLQPADIITRALVIMGTIHIARWKRRRMNAV
jgi:hypothetical protein